MLKHWYFGCCVNLSRRQIDFLLAAMKVLEQPEENYSLLRITYCELARADIWTRAYALSAALEARRRLSKPDQVNSDLLNLCESFGPFLTDPLQSSFSSAVSYMCRESNSDLQLSHLATFAKRVIEHGSRHRPRLKTPYLDSEAFLPAILLLSLLLVNREVARRVLEKSDVLAFMEKARKEQFGRHAFVLASRLILRYPRIFSVAVYLGELTTLFGHQVLLEPDLAETDMNARFMLRKPEEYADTAGWLIQELQQFNHFYGYYSDIKESVGKSRYHTKSRDPQVEATERLILERQGFLSSVSSMRTWGLLCRYWAWLKSFMSLEPGQLASLLSQDWLQVDFKEALSLGITFPSNFRETQHDQSVVLCNMLAGYFRLPVRFGMHKSSPITYSGAAKILLSPWFPGFEFVEGQQAKIIEKKSFLSTSKGLWLRMAISSWVAADLMVIAEGISNSDRKFLSQFLAHSATQFSGLQSQFNWVRKKRELEDFQDIGEWPRHQEALMVASRDYVMRAGAGLYKGIGPDVFMSTMNNETTSGCIQFVQYGYVQGNESGGPDRWREHLPQLIKRFGIGSDNAQNQVQNEERLLPALLRRYLLTHSQSKSLPQEDILLDDLLKTRVTEFFNGKSNQRWLLLLTKEKATKNIKECFRSYSMNASDPTKKGTRLLVSAIQYLIVQGWNDQIEREYWQEALLDSLWQVDERWHADRFLRLLLLETIQSPLVVTDELLQRAIAFFILEWGSAHDLRVLIEKMFIPNKKESRLALSTANRNVNKTLFKKLLNYRGMLIDDDDRVLGAIHPWHISLDIMRQEVVDCGLSAIINTAWHDHYDELENGSGYLLEILDNHKLKKRIEKCRALSWRNIDLTKYVHSDRVYDIINRSAGVVTDPSNERILWLHDPFLSPTPDSCPTNICDSSEPTTINLFTGGHDVLEIFQNSTDRIRVVAVVMEIQMPGNRETLVKLNIGADRIRINAKMLNFLASKLKLGDCGRIDIEKSSENKWKYCSGSWQKYPCELPDYDMLTLVYNDGAGQPFRVTHQQNDITDFIDLEYWTPDIAGLLKRAVHPHNVSAFCRCLNGRWEPCSSVPSDLIDSLWRQNGSPIGVVTFVQTEECETHNNTHNTFWQFALSESERFLLSPSDFSPIAADFLEQRFTSGTDKRGLLIAIRWNQDLQRFELVDRVPESRSNKPEAHFCFYSDMELPIDDRNLRWRSLFRIGDRVMAKPINSPLYSISLEEDQKINDFPDFISLKIRNEKWPQRFEFEAEITDWSAAGQRSCTVFGKPSYTPMFTFGRLDKQKLLEAWINIDRGDIIELRGTRSFPRFEQGWNLATCETIFSTIVKVDPHSLSMQPLPSFKPSPDPAKGRLAEVTRTKWRESVQKPLIDSTDLPKRDLPEEMIGVLTTLPNVKSKNTSCVVFWRIDGRFIATRIKISNLAALRIQEVGCKIVGRRDPQEVDGWNWTVYQPDIFARALWHCSEEVNGRHHEMYIGPVRFIEQSAGRASQRTLHLAEAEPGTFQILDASPQVIPFSRWIEGAYVPGLSNQIKLQYYRANFDSLRANIKWGEKWLPVIVRQKMQDKATVHVNNFDVTVNAVGAKPIIGSLQGSISEGYYTISTELDLILSESYEKDQESAARSMAESLREALDKELPIKAEIRDGRAFMKGQRVPVSGSLCDLEKQWPWTHEIQIEEDQLAFITFFEYDGSESNVILYETGEKRIAASCTRVKPLSLSQYVIKSIDDYKPEIGKEYQYHPAMPLHYVKPFSILENSDTGVPVQRRYHLFEWEYGCTMAVSEKNLQFRGQPFSDAKLAVWHGDKIITMIFTHPAEQYPELILNITHAEEFYDTHELYEQSAARVLHHLEITLQEQFEVHRVKGLERRKDRGLENSRRIFDRAPIYLTEETQELLRAKIKERKVNSSFSFSILGKMEAQRVIEERGTRVLYSYVVPSLSDMPANSVVLLKAEGVRESATDLMLELSYPYDEQFPFLDASTPQNQLSHVTVLRRQFSARQDRLMQVAYKIKEALIPVSLRRPSKKYPHPRGVIIDNENIMVPMRRHELVEHLLQHGVILGLMAKDFRPSDRNLWLELYPSVFVKLDLAIEPDKYSFEFPGSCLLKGDKILLKKIGSGIISIKLSAAGHRNFISYQSRPAVMLPHNDLLWPFPTKSKTDGASNDMVFLTLDESFWDSPKAIASVGGLPDIQAFRGGRYGNDHKSGKGTPNREEFLEWMMGQHPKIAMVAKEPGPKTEIREMIRYFPTIMKPQGDWVVGSLDLTSGPLTIRVKEWDFKKDREAKESIQQPAFHSLDWQDATFCDQPARRIRKRIEESKWRYHDQSTAYWRRSSSDGEERLFYQRQAIELPPTPSSGPLFFQVIDDKFRLRFTSDVFLKFAFPVDEVLSVLRNQHSQEETLTVALAESSGLWVEIAPGRVAEVPGAMCWKKPARLSKAVSLENLEWRTFAPGDRIRLQLTTGDADTDGSFALERFLVVDWEFGPRQSLFAGEGTCFMPILDYNSVEGSVTLGGGQFSLTLPASESIHGEVAFQYANNSFRSANGQKPRSGDVVLLELTRGGKFRIAGFPKYCPCPDSRQKKMGANNADRITRIMRNNDDLRAFLEAIGNFLPVTVVSVSSTMLIFDTSSERQAVLLSPGSVGEALICGWLPWQEKAILRIGSKFLIAGLHEFISGIPKDNHLGITESLIESQVAVWVRCDSDRHIQYDLSANYFSDDFEVETATRIIRLTEEAPEKTPQCGVICRNTNSGGLVWLSMQQATMAQDISFDEWQTILDHQTMRKMRVCSLADHSVSLTRINAVEKAFEAYRLGRELAVRVMTPKKALETNCLAWSDNLKAIVRVVDCDSYSPDQNIPVEIVERRRTEDMLILGVTPRGKRRWKVNFPGRKELHEDIGLASTILTVDAEPTVDVNAPQLQQSPSPLFDNYTDLDDALEKIISLANNRSFNQAAITLQHLGAHALCSLHLEIFATYWTNNLDNRDRQDGEWQRLKIMIEELWSAASGPGLYAEQIRRLKQVIRAVELKTIIPENGEAPVILLLSTALAVAAGIRIEPEQFYLMSRRCEILNEILSYFLSYPVCKQSMPIGLLEEHKKNIDIIRKKIRANRLEIKVCSSLEMLTL